MNLFLKSATIAFAALAFASPSFANVAYHYSGHMGTNPDGTLSANSEGTSAYPYVPLHAPITFDFTVAAPLAVNLSGVDLLSLSGTVLSWTASGGTALSTITSSDPGQGSERIRISTDAVGNITTYNIVVSAQVAAQPTTTAQLLFDRALTTSTQSSEAVKIYGTAYGNLIASATCPGYGGCGGSTSFAALAVPEASTSALMLSGLGLVAFVIRRRKA